MRLDLLPFLRCPSGCTGDLIVCGTPDGDQILTGALTCPQCHLVNPIQQGIARLLPTDIADYPTEAPADKPEDAAIALKRAEMACRDDQVEEYDRMWYLTLYGFVEIPMTLAMLSPAQDHVILEAGCGTGRMTQAFAGRCDRLIAADFSWESLKVCQEKMLRAGVTNIDYIQADICRLPLKHSSVDRAASCGVLEHIPTPESRQEAIRDINRVLKPGGVLALSAYNHTLLMRLLGDREGKHAGRIYYHRFDREELRDLLSTAFNVDTITGALVYYLVARCRKSMEAERYA